jgi:hypothetical protein
MRRFDRYEYPVRTVGWYSSRARGERAKRAGLNFLHPLASTL